MEIEECWRAFQHSIYNHKKHFSFFPFQKREIFWFILHFILSSSFLLLQDPEYLIQSKGKKEGHLVSRNMDMVSEQRVTKSDISSFISSMLSQSEERREEENENCLIVSWTEERDSK